MQKIPALTAQELFKIEKEEWLAEARQVAERLLLDRETITIQDVLVVHPLPSFIKKNFLGKVFQNNAFQKVSVERSTSLLAHGHYITRWRLNPSLYPTSMRVRIRKEMEEYGDD